MREFRKQILVLGMVLLTGVAFTGCDGLTARSNKSSAETPSRTSTPSPTVTHLPSPTPVPTPTPVLKPTDADGRRMVESQIKAQSNGLIRLVSFQKTDGVDRERDGTKLYELDYTAEIEFLGNAIWHSRSFEAYRRQPRSSGGDDVIADLPEEPMAYPDKGERRKINRRLMFEKTERGWRLVQP